MTTTRRACLTVWAAWTRAGRWNGGAEMATASSRRGPTATALGARPSLLLCPFSSASGGSNPGGDDATPSSSPYRVISIDRAGLGRGGEEEKAGDGGASAGKQPLSSPRSPGESALTPHLRSLITFRGGPLTVSEYMATCLTHPTAGYYTSKAAVFGGRGDFVTGPEVSQLMGELVGIWCASEWAGALGRPPAVRIVELGPGKGTLAADLLRGAVGLAGGAWADAIREIVFVEVSPARRAEQWAALACSPDGATPSPPPSTDGHPPIESALSLLTVPKGTRPVRVTWVPSLGAAPAAGPPTLYLAHEFFDALPVHHFQRVDRGQKAGGKRGKGNGGSSGDPTALSAWRERLVDVTPPADPLAPPFRFVLAPSQTPASTTILPRRLACLEPGLVAGLDAIEVCPAGMALAGELARRVTGEAGRGEAGSGDGSEAGQAAVGSGAGSALIIDYGRASPPYADSLVGIKGHAPASALASPGEVDLSARVDFGALAQAAVDGESGGSTRVAVHGPIPQAHFLLGLGLGARVAALEAAAGGAETEAGRAVRLGALRLVGGHEDDGEGEEEKEPSPPGEEGGDADEDVFVEGMGYTYQVMALTPGGRAPPAPFF